MASPPSPETKCLTVARMVDLPEALRIAVAGGAERFAFEHVVSLTKQAKQELALLLLQKHDIGIHGHVYGDREAVVRL